MLIAPHRERLRPRNRLGLAALAACVASVAFSLASIAHSPAALYLPPWPAIQSAFVGAYCAVLGRCEAVGTVEARDLDASWDVQAAMDFGVEACDNFFQHSCGGARLVAEVACTPQGMQPR